MPDLPQNTLEHYVNAHVQIYYNPSTGLQDSGLLAYRDSHGVELLKDNGDRLLIPAASIRIIKLLDKAALHADAQILLRPAENAPQKQITGEK